MPFFEPTYSFGGTGKSFSPVPTPTRGGAGVSAIFGRNAEAKWGSQLIRIASDIILVCTEELVILHHNRAFLKAVGYGEGSFVGQQLPDFIPREESESVVSAFRSFSEGHAAGMRFSFPLLTTSGTSRFVTRVVRSRHPKGAYRYYLVARGESKVRKTELPVQEELIDPLFQKLPVAVWRTDGDLVVSQACGNLWPDLGVKCKDLVGGKLSDATGLSIPRVLLEIDFSDPQDGNTLHTDLVWHEKNYTVTVEPFFDEAGELLATVGTIRRARVIESDFAPVSLFPSGKRLEIRKRAGSRRVLHDPLENISPDSFEFPVPTRLDGRGVEPAPVEEDASGEGTECVALAN